MKVTLADAYELLKLPYGAQLREVETQYQILAHRYHTKNALKEFEKVSCAYKRIASLDSTDQVDMDMETMKDLFNSLFGSGARNGRRFTEDGEESTTGSEYSHDEYRDRTKEEQHEQMAKQLIGEEEKEKRKAEKRRAKKKKRREKKKLEKEQEAHAIHNGGGEGHNETPNGIRSSDEGEGIDLNAAFVKKSSKKKTEAPATVAGKIENTSLPGPQVADRLPDVGESGDSSISNTKRSRLIANKGNESAHEGDYPTAIRLFSEAISLEPSDYRFYGNRSYCYDRLMKFDKALSDADKCIELAQDWAKGYFRKGRALAGLKKFADAEKAFTQVLRLDKSCEEACKELSRVRTQQLIDMGFHAKDAEKAVINKNSLQQALDALLAEGLNTEVTISGDDVYISDDEDEEDMAASAPLPSTQKIANNVKAKTVKAAALPHNAEMFTEEKKMDPTNPEGLTALWVGNVLPTVRDADLQTLFSRYGEVSSVRCLPEKFCAFVNFKSKEAAGKAMNALQNQDVKGQKLLIKFPDNPIAQTKVVKTSLPSNAVRERRDRPAGMTSKVSGPVNGDECYYWRTTGCQFGNKCRHKHLPESKGVDRKPWHRVKQ